MKYLIEMDLPDDLDPSTVLEAMQEIAVQLHESVVPDEDQDGDDVPLDDEAIKNSVSVQAVAIAPPHCTDKHCESPLGHPGVHQLSLRVKL